MRKKTVADLCSYFTIRQIGCILITVREDLRDSKIRFNDNIGTPIIINYFYNIKFVILHRNLTIVLL